MQSAHTIRGSYSNTCNKRAYATEHLAKAQLRLLRARGRTEQAHYKCPQCSMYHLTGRRPETTYRMEANNTIEVNGTTIGFSRKVRQSETVVGMVLSYSTHEGVEKRNVYNMTRDQAQMMLDALIEALYDNTEDEQDP